MSSGMQAWLRQSPYEEPWSGIRIKLPAKQPATSWADLAVDKARL